MSKKNTTAQGNAFRDEIKRLLELTPGCTNVDAEVQIGTQQVDIYYEERTSFATLRIACECKDYGVPLTKDLIGKKIFPRYSVLLKNNLVDAVRIIAPLDIQATARAFVKECGFSFQTADQVASQLIDFRQYMSGRIAAFSEDGLDSYYVRPILDSDEDLEQVVLNWIQVEAGRPFAILAGYGMGKTSFARRLTYLFAKEALNNSARRIPIFIPLSEISGEQDLEGLLGKLFAAQHRPQGYHFDLFLELNRRGRFVIILDGFDEMKHTISWSEFDHNFSQLNRLHSPQAKVILLGRPSALMSESEELFVLRGQRREGAQVFTVEGAPDYQEFRLRQFSGEQSLDFMRRYAAHRSKTDSALREEVLSHADIETRIAEIQSDEEMMSLIGRPVQAKMLTDLAMDPAVQWRSFTRYGLYKEFIRRICERETRKPSRVAFKADSRMGFLRRLAWWVWRRSSSSGFRIVEMPDNILSGLPNLVDADMHSTKRDLVAGSLLEKKSADTYYFPHRSFLEFLVAEFMCEEGSPPSSVELAHFAISLTPEIRDFIKESAHKSAVARWAEHINEPDMPLSAELLMLVAWALNETNAPRNERGSASATPRDVMIDYFRISADSNQLSEATNFLGRTFHVVTDIQSRLTCILGMLHAQQNANDTLRDGIQKRIASLILGESLDELIRILERSTGAHLAVEKRNPFVNLLVGSFKAEIKSERLVLTVNPPPMYDNLWSALSSRWRMDGFPFAVDRAFAPIHFGELAQVDRRLALSEKGGVVSTFFKQFPDPAALIPILPKYKRETRRSLSLHRRDNR